MKNFIVYKSSAGSGKTFTLVKEYLLLVLSHPENLSFSFRSVLAITFTNKASAEMKWRIIKSLKELEQGVNQTLSEIICSELKITNHELASRSGIVLSQILHHYSDFSISTIDSFTHRIIRTFATDLKLPVNFQIETDTNYVFGKIVSLLLNQLGKNKTLSQYLVHYSINKVEENKSWDLESGLLEFIKELYNEGRSSIIESLQQFDLEHFNAVNKKISERLKHYESTLHINGTKALALIKNNGLSESDFYQGNKGIINLFKKLSDPSKLFSEALENSFVRATLEDDKWCAAKISSEQQNKIEHIKYDLKRITEDSLKFIKEHESYYALHILIKKNLYAMGVVNELAKITTQFKSEENILFISEFNEKISEVVAHEPTPFIYERLGDKFKHFLLDEFQDTSTLQWQNILPLVDNSLSNGWFNLLVGDGKQSIYRWRNANVEQFSNLPKIIGSDENAILKEREDSLKRHFENRQLDKNYRSRAEVVKFNNSLFDFLSEKFLHDEFKNIYHHQAQKYNEDSGGYVTIEFPETPKHEKDPVNFQYTLKHIHQAIENGYQYQDICVIVRNNKAGNAIANFLIQQQIPVISSESLLLKNAIEINLIISFLKFLSNEKDLVSASSVINYLFHIHFITEDQYTGYLKDLNLSKQKNLFDIFSELQLPIQKEKILTKNLYDICIELTEVLSLQERNQTYIRFFLDEVLSFLQSNTSNLNLFIDWWDRRSETASVIIPEGANAISIMTIHKSKGLEFPIVIMPYLNWKTHDIEQLWVPIQDTDIDLPMAMIDTSNLASITIYSEQAERERQFQILDNLNLIYVGFTRAVECLHIISPTTDKENENYVSSWLKSFVLHHPNYSSEFNALIIGQLTKKTSSFSLSGNEIYDLNPIHFNTSHEAIELKGSSKYHLSNDVEKAKAHGILIHYILSQIKTLEEIPEKINKSVVQGDLNQQDAINIQLNITDLLSFPELSVFYKSGLDIRNEVEILTETGEVLRPDRVIIQDNRATIIDYKTGKKNPSKYHAQMKSYELAMNKLGISDVKKILVYIDEKSIETIQ